MGSGVLVSLYKDTILHGQGGEKSAAQGTSWTGVTREGDLGKGIPGSKHFFDNTAQQNLEPL